MEYKTVYKVKDGTTFDTKAEVEAYIKLLETPHVKKLLDRIQKLEQDVLTMKAEIATLHREPAIKPFDPYQRPIGILNANCAASLPESQKIYNQATGGNYNG